MLYPNASVKQIDSENKGIFATRDIKKGEVAWRLDSNEKLLTKEERDSLSLEIQKLAFQYKDHFVVVHDQSEFMNHSCGPNLGFSSDEELSAIKDIKAGEELTYDYSTADVGDWVASWECKCGSKNCRKKITGKDCLDKKFQEKYKGFLPSWVLKYINENE